ncbi:hypothetical protein HK103_001538 [Boothiomyces macroporosus]|uniref:Uncharacterized protein n=1 Tax=Boothiomyces macroporosus TaxID=261099 RepID=A0AAD5Y4W0_9FUNG|nr:hypothetical protein HK103_001538 [Boothiomyces macroporosus]
MKSVDEQKTLSDGHKKLEILFDQMNSHQVEQGVIGQLSAFSKGYFQLILALEQGDYSTALKVEHDLRKNHFTATGQWIVGIKRLLDGLEKLSRPAPSPAIQPAAPRASFSSGTGLAPPPTSSAKFGAPPIPSGNFMPPPMSNQFGAPPISSNQFGAPPISSNQYGAPPISSNQYGAPPVSTSYNHPVAPPPTTTNYGAPPISSSYTATPANFAPPPIQNNPPPVNSFGPPPTRTFTSPTQTFTNPPPTQNFTSPPPNQYGAPPVPVSTQPSSFPPNPSPLAVQKNELSPPPVPTGNQQPPVQNNVQAPQIPPPVSKMNDISFATPPPVLAPANTPNNFESTKVPPPPIVNPHVNGTLAPNSNQGSPSAPPTSVGRPPMATQPLPQQGLGNVMLDSQTQQGQTGFSSGSLGIQNTKSPVQKPLSTQHSQQPQSGQVGGFPPKSPPRFNQMPPVGTRPPSIANIQRPVVSNVPSQPLNRPPIGAPIPNRPPINGPPLNGPSIGVQPVRPPLTRPVGPPPTSFPRPAGNQNPFN